MINHYLTLLLLSTMILSCEDVIHVDVDGRTEDLVIDAWIDNRPQQQVIALTLSKNLFDTQPSIKVSDAEVMVHNLSTGAMYDFEYHIDNQNYIWQPADSNQIGDVNDIIELTVHHNGETYSSQTTINRVPAIDSIGQEYLENEIFYDDGYYLQFYARDFQGQGDAYWIKAYKNGEYISNTANLNIAFDAGFDAGSRIDGIVFINPIRELINPIGDDDLQIPWEIGEYVNVEIHSLTEEAFTFLDIARDQINNGNNGIFALPQANVKSNIYDSSGKRGLGFFNVAAVSNNEHTVMQ